MAGTAGSKYGVVKDGIPIKASQIKPRKKFKSLNRLLKRKKKQTKDSENNRGFGGTNGGGP
jgi:hypothetical protein